MKNANLSFKGQIPFNEEFGDIYFNTDKPWLESEFVFASALDEIWQSKDSFISSHFVRNLKLATKNFTSLVLKKALLKKKIF